MDKNNNKSFVKVDIWYKVSNKGGGWGKYYSLEQLLSEKKRWPYFPILKITKVTEELLPQEVVDNINNQVDYEKK